MSAFRTQLYHVLHPQISKSIPNSFLRSTVGTVIEPRSRGAGAHGARTLEHSEALRNLGEGRRRCSLWCRSFLVQCTDGLVLRRVQTAGCGRNMLAS